MKNNTIGKRIAEARINRNITQEHLEELSGLSVSTISRIETGKYMPTIENLLKLSEILDVGLDYFLYDLLPHNKDIQSPAIQDAISIMNQMGERQTEYIVKILKIYQALIRIKYNYNSTIFVFLSSKSIFLTSKQQSGNAFYFFLFYVYNFPFSHSL